jgi:hypothetical protein
MAQQSSSVVLTDNKLTISIGANLILVNRTITLSGFVATSTADQILNLDFGGNNYSQNLASTAPWTKATGTLDLNVLRMEPKTNYTFSFTIKNPPAGQASPPVYAEIIGFFFKIGDQVSSSLIMKRQV